MPSERKKDWQSHFPPINVNDVSTFVRWRASGSCDDDDIEPVPWSCLIEVNRSHVVYGCAEEPFGCSDRSPCSDHSIDHLLYLHLLPIHSLAWNTTTSEQSCGSRSFDDHISPGEHIDCRWSMWQTLDSIRSLPNCRWHWCFWVQVQLLSDPRISVDSGSSSIIFCSPVACGRWPRLVFNGIAWYFIDPCLTDIPFSATIFLWLSALSIRSFSTLPWWRNIRAYRSWSIRNGHAVAHVISMRWERFSCCHEMVRCTNRERLICYLACSWNIGLADQRMFGRSFDLCSHFHYYHSCSSPEKSGDKSTFSVASKSSFNHSARCCLCSLHVRLVTVCHLFRHHSIYACAFPRVTLFNVPKLLSIRLESSLSLRLSSGFTSREESSENLQASQINAGAASCSINSIDQSVLTWAHARIALESTHDLCNLWSNGSDFNEDRE